MTCTSKPTESSVLPGKPGTYEHTLETLTQLAQNPGWKAWAWHYAKELDAEQSGYFRGMAADLKAAMTGLAKAGASEGQTPTKRP